MLRDFGLTDAQIAGARTWYDFSSPDLQAGRTMDDVLLALASATSDAVVEVDAFARAVANVRLPLQTNQAPVARIDTSALTFATQYHERRLRLQQHGRRWAHRGLQLGLRGRHDERPAVRVPEL